MNDIDELIELVFTMNRLTKEGMEHEKGSPSYIQLHKNKQKTASHEVVF